MTTPIGETCPWLIEVASGNPEPDSYADTVMTIECGSPLYKVNDARRLVCKSGHTFPSYQDWCEAPEYLEERRTM